MDRNAVPQMKVHRYNELEKRKKTIRRETREPQQEEQRDENYFTKFSRKGRTSTLNTSICKPYSLSLQEQT